MSTSYVIEAKHWSGDPELHHLSQNLAVLPWLGGYGRMTQERCQAARLVFTSREEAEAMAKARRVPNSIWTYTVVPLPEPDNVVASEMPKPQTWKEQIASFTAAEIIAVLGCPQATAYSWKREQSPRTPPAWQQPLFLSHLRRSRLK